MNRIPKDKSPVRMAISAPQETEIDQNKGIHKESYHEITCTKTDSRFSFDVFLEALMVGPGLGLGTAVNPGT